MVHVFISETPAQNRKRKIQNKAKNWFDFLSATAYHSFHFSRTWQAEIGTIL